MDHWRQPEPFEETSRYVNYKISEQQHVTDSKPLVPSISYPAFISHDFFVKRWIS